MRDAREVASGLVVVVVRRRRWTAGECGQRVEDVFEMAVGVATGETLVQIRRRAGPRQAILGQVVRAAGSAGSGDHAGVGPGFAVRSREVVVVVGQRVLWPQLSGLFALVQHLLQLLWRRQL